MVDGFNGFNGWFMWGTAMVDGCYGFNGLECGVVTNMGGDHQWLVNG